MRIDKWLWAARFHLTRKLATQSVECGRVLVNGVTAKPSQLVRPGDVLNFRVVDREWEIVVREMHTSPVSLKEAKLMYEETATSQERHIQSVEMKRIGLHRISLQSVIHSRRTERQD
ncbi:MAG: RNA-binding S4 domain-containing protein [Propionivibrio sp.]|nr:RNA-binding S4 domain-containing protein [Propionivibrio sp.]